MNEQIFAIAVLDGWRVATTEHFKLLQNPVEAGTDIGMCCGLHLRDDEVWAVGLAGDENGSHAFPDYLHSYDAIISVIQKQDSTVQSLVYSALHELFFWEYTPAQLCQALLRATGKWKD